jgi:hypothetical protein
MSSESVFQVARSWVDMGSFHTRLAVRFMIFTASVRNIFRYIGRTTMSSESVYQVSRSWVDVVSFNSRLAVRFMIL